MGKIHTLESYVQNDSKDHRLCDSMKSLEIFTCQGIQDLQYTVVRRIEMIEDQNS